MILLCRAVVAYKGANFFTALTLACHREYSKGLALPGIHTVTRYRQSSTITAQAVEDETLLLDVAGNNIHQLNATASLVWDNCNGDTDEEQLVRIMLEHYTVEPAIARTDVRNILNQLLALKAIEAVEHDT